MQLSSVVPVTPQGSSGDLVLWPWAAQLLLWSEKALERLGLGVSFPVGTSGAVPFSAGLWSVLGTQPLGKAAAGATSLPPGGLHLHTLKRGRGA